MKQSGLWHVYFDARGYLQHYKWIAKSEIKLPHEQCIFLLLTAPINKTGFSVNES